MVRPDKEDQCDMFTYEDFECVTVDKSVKIVPNTSVKASFKQSFQINNGGLDPKLNVSPNKLLSVNASEFKPSMLSHNSNNTNTQNLNLNLNVPELYSDNNNSSVVKSSNKKTSDIVVNEIELISGSLDASEDLNKKIGN